MCLFTYIEHLQKNLAHSFKSNCKQVIDRGNLYAFLFLLLTLLQMFPILLPFAPLHQAPACLCSSPPYSSTESLLSFCGVLRYTSGIFSPSSLHTVLLPWVGISLNLLWGPWWLFLHPVSMAATTNQA